jgi:hypothetical protein
MQAPRKARAPGATFTFTAVLGRTFDIGKRNITISTVKVGATTYVDGVDYFSEQNKGIIRLPVVAVGITAGATVVVTYNAPALTRESYTAFNNLNQTGVLQLFEMDNKSPIPMAEWNITGNLTADTAGDVDATKHKQWTMKFSVDGQPTCLRRAA